MSRGGRRIKWGGEPTTTTNLDGIWNLNEINNLIGQTKWPRGPVAPTSLSATAGGAQLSLSWTAPATTNGNITNYLVEYTASGGSAQYVLTNSTSTSYTLTGLTNGTAYSVRVAAVNFMAGDYSSTATGTPAAGSLTLVQQGSYGVSGSGTSVSPWKVTTTAGGGDIPTWQVTGTLNIRFTFLNHEHDDDGWTPSSEFVYRTSVNSVIQKNDGRSVATLGAILVASGRNTTVDANVSDCFLQMRRRNSHWGPHADGGAQTNEGKPSIQFFVI